MKLSIKLLIGFLLIASTSSVSGIIGFNGYDNLEEIIKLLHTTDLEHEIKEEIIKEQTDKIRGTIIFASSIGIITAIGLGLYFSTLIVIPLKKLELAAKRVGKGDMDVKIIHKKNDEIGEFVETFNQMTDSIKKVIELEKDLAVSQKQVKTERFVAIGELSARLAHDIRNPLGIIRTSMDNIISIKETDPARFVKNTERIDRAIVRITHQIEGVMDFLRDTELELIQINISDIIENIISELNMSDEVKINLMKNNISIQADKVKLESLFSNIVLNALQAINNKGNIAIRILEESNDFVIIEIEDDGPQIPKENLEKIFEALFTTKQTGTGLGLASCKAIVEQHEGTISVTNEPVIFKIKLPTKQKSK